MQNLRGVPGVGRKAAAAAKLIPKHPGQHASLPNKQEENPNAPPDEELTVKESTPSVFFSFSVNKLSRQAP